MLNAEHTVAQHSTAQQWSGVEWSGDAHAGKADVSFLQMTTEQLKVTVQTRKGHDLCDLILSTDATVDDLKLAFHAKFPKYHPNRQYFKLKHAPKVALKMKDSQLVTDYHVKDGDIIVFKHLGIQVSWRFVFFVEYFGPLALHPLFYFFPSIFYPGLPQVQKRHVQTIAMWLCVVHYAKREFETLFIHRFSNGTMPVFNIFKNSFHYWALGGAFIAYFIHHPLYTQFLDDETVNILAGICVICMLGNFYSHIILMNLRPAGSTKRAVPRGFLFEYISCPNYFFEILEWIVFSIMTQSLSAAIFAVVSAGQMWIWAVGKHKRYRKEFDGKEGKELYPRSRRILVPFIL